MSYMSYVLEKARSAATTIASGGGDLDSALAAAAMELSLLRSEEMPIEIRQSHARIIRGLTAAPAETDNGTIHDTLAVVPTVRKRRLAEHVVTFYGEVSRWCGAVEGRRDSGEDLSNTSALPPAIYWDFLDWELGLVAAETDKSEYVRYAKIFLPNFPNDVISEWIGRHVQTVLSEWAHLGFERFSFVGERWPMERIKTIQPRDPTFSAVGPSSFGGNQLKNLKSNWLVASMTREGTWPVPIIVLDNSQSLNDGWGKLLPSGLVLVEGHRRFSYLVNLAPLGLAKDEHDVWMVRIDKGRSAPSLEYLGE